MEFLPKNRIFSSKIGKKSNIDTCYNEEKEASIIQSLLTLMMNEKKSIAWDQYDWTDQTYCAIYSVVNVEVMQ